MALSTSAKVAIGCVSALVGACGLSCVALGIWAATGHEGGVRYANDAEPYAVQAMRQAHALEDAETMIAYYDESVSLDGSQMTIVTDRRVISLHDGHALSIPFEEVRDVTQHDEGMMGTRITIHGERTVIVANVAAMDAAEGLAEVIEQRRRIAAERHGGATVGAGDAGDEPAAEVADEAPKPTPPGGREP